MKVLIKNAAEMGTPQLRWRSLRVILGSSLCEHALLCFHLFSPFSKAEFMHRVLEAVNKESLGIRQRALSFAIYSEINLSMSNKLEGQIHLVQLKLNYSTQLLLPELKLLKTQLGWLEIVAEIVPHSFTK